MQFHNWLKLSLLLTTMAGFNLVGLPAQAASLFVGSFNNDSVLRYDAQTGQFQETFVSFGSGGLDGPVALTFGSDDNFYVVSIFTDSVLRYDGQTGSFLNTFAEANENQAINSLQDLTFGNNGNLYVSGTSVANSNRVLEFDGQTGDFLGNFVSSGSGGIVAPFGVRFGPDGNFYVSGTFSNNIVRYDGQTGDFLNVFAVTNPEDFPGGLTFGPDGNLYVANFGTSTINRYDGETGTLIDIFVDNARGELDGPVQPIFGLDGNLYISSLNTNTVLRYDGITGDFIDEFIPAGTGGLDGAGWLAFREDPITVSESSHNLGLLALTTCLLVSTGCPKKN